MFHRLTNGMLTAAAIGAAIAFGRQSLADDDQGGIHCVEIVPVQRYVDLGDGKVVLLPQSGQKDPNMLLRFERKTSETPEPPHVLILRPDGRIEPHRTTPPWPSLSTGDDGKPTPGTIGAACGIPGGLTFWFRPRRSLA